MNLRETPAWREIAAMLSSCPVAARASTAAATRSRLTWVSSRREAIIASPWALMRSRQSVAGQGSGAPGG